MIRFVHLLAVLSLLSGCQAEYVIIPGTARDAYWEGCGGWWHCNGSGPIHRVCTEDVWWIFGFHLRDCQWRRIDPRGGLGAAVPYKEPRS